MKLFRDYIFPFELCPTPKPLPSASASHFGVFKQLGALPWQPSRAVIESIMGRRSVPSKRPQPVIILCFKSSSDAGEAKWGFFKNKSESTLMLYPVIAGDVQLSLLACDLPSPSAFGSVYLSSCEMAAPLSCLSLPDAAC